MGRAAQVFIELGARPVREKRLRASLPSAHRPSTDPLLDSAARDHSFLAAQHARTVSTAGNATPNSQSDGSSLSGNNIVIGGDTKMAPNTNPSPSLLDLLITYWSGCLRTHHQDRKSSIGGQSSPNASHGFEFFPPDSAINEKTMRHKVHAP